MVIESLLKKSKRVGSTSRYFSKFNTRYFILDLVNGSFFYLVKRNAKKVEKSYSLYDIVSYEE
jgi:hypothetical protein